MHMHILLVEDERKLAAAVKRALELQGYTVEVAPDGNKAIELGSTDRFDIIILDIMLPHYSGIEVCTELRSQNIQTPILMLTAKGQVRDKTTGLDAGADDYLVKPFAFEELFSRIKALLRRNGKNTQTIVTLGDLQLDVVQHTVLRAGIPISLSVKEFAILEYMLRNIAVPLSKQKILDHVWEYDTNILPSTIEVHIKNLRDKIDKPFSTPLIHTVRGVGYQLAVKDI